MTSRRQVWLVLVAMQLAGCRSCFGGPPPAPPAAADEPGASIDPELTLGLPPDQAQRVLAVIDGEPLRVLDVAREIERAGPTASARWSDARQRRALVENLIRMRALAVEARRRGLGDDPRVAVARDEVLVRALLDQLAADVPPPTDTQVRAYYEAHRDDYREPPLRSVGLIFTRDRGAGEAALAEILADRHHEAELWMRAAERIGFAGPRRQAREETEMFAASPRAGEPFVAQVVRDVAFAGEPGQIHPELVPFEDGFYLVRIDRHADAVDVPFEAVRDRIARMLHDAALDARAEMLVSALLDRLEPDEAALATVRLPE
jgi:peptidyl-prolyl cis-trans isomerase C